MQKITARRTS